MILQKSFYYADLILLSVLKSVVLLNIFVETVIPFLGFFDEKKVQANRIYLEQMFW